jgi:peptidoglycan/xylan/chitin deacetylase (PgdA/CDA1 family)
MKFARLPAFPLAFLSALASLIFCGLSPLAAQVSPPTTQPGPEPTAQHAPLQIALTFDDLPAHGPLAPGEFRPEPIRSILKTLKAEQLPPVYGFVNGFRVAEYPYQAELLREWIASGNALGSHTWSHPALDKMSAKKYIANIAENEPLLKRVDPRGDWHWFRYPYLEEGNTLEKREAVRGYLFAHQYKIADVTLDFGDYMWNDAYARCAVHHDETAIASLHDSYLATADEYITYSRTLSQRLYGRDIPYVLLLHVGAFDARMLPDLIALFRQRGFTFVTLPQAESDPAYSVDPKIAYPGGGLFIELTATALKVNTPDATEPEAELNSMCR